MHSQDLNHSFSKILFQSKKLSKTQILQKLSQLMGSIYLENNGHPIIGFLPKQYCLVKNNQFNFYSRKNITQFIEEPSIQNLEQFLRFNVANKAQNLNSNVTFTGGYMGFIDYNFAANLHIQTHLKCQPNIFIGQYESFLKFENEQWIFHSTEAEAEAIFDQLKDLLSSDYHPSFKLTQACTATWEKYAYQHAFDTVQDYIRAGDCYQINLTQEFKANADGLLIDTAEDFWALTNAPYSAYLRLDEFELLSCSPELFIDFLPNRKIVTKPIKGTMPRYADPILDAQSKLSLQTSKKDQAENIMIVDLLRNDLSIYAEIGTVQTPKIFNIESFNQVHHMVSEVTAVLKSGVNPFDMLLSALPGGSITGAPKKRAMEIIEELEHAPRGAYCGSMGFFNFDGTGSWNILIRSIQKFQNDISIWAGGGITIASNCDDEYQECFDKVNAMLNLLNQYH